VPASGLGVTPGGELPPDYGPAPGDRSPASWLQQRLTQVARVQSLLKLASWSDEGVRGDAGVRVGTELRLLAGNHDREGRPLTPDRRVVFHDDDRLMIRLSNPNRFPVEVTFPYVNGGLGIDSLFPESVEINRLDPVEIRPIPTRITGATTGMEHLVDMAVKGTGGQPADFRILAQPTLDAARVAERTRGAPGMLDSPLGRLLRQAVFANGGTRSVASYEIDEYLLDMLS